MKVYAQSDEFLSHFIYNRCIIKNFEGVNWLQI